MRCAQGKGSLRSVLAAVSKWTTKAGPFKTVSKEAKAKALRACSEHASHSLSRQIGALFLHPGWSSGAELLKVGPRGAALRRVCG
eukprot:scaffold546_cov352-Prasinococcus_capsulatus_cf.AAC.15